MSFRQMGLKYKFMAISIASIVLTTFIGSLLLHFLVKQSGAYSDLYVILVAMFFILVGLIGVMALTKYMIQPVVFLTNKVYQVQRGNLNVEIQRKRTSAWMDEMDRLFEGFDHMVHHLKETIEALTAAKEKAERASHELYESKRKLEAIFNSLSDGLMIIDREFRILNANPVMAEFMGRPLDQIFNEHCYEMCNGSLQKCSFCRASETFQTGRHRSTYCTKAIGPDNSERILEVHDFPLYNEKGEILHIIEYVKDVTDAIKMQANLESSRRLAEIGQMAAKVAHEVRNPLNAIKGATHYLRAEMNNQEYESYLNLIEDQVERVNGVATNLLNLSKPLKPVFQPGKLERVIENSLKITENILNTKQIQVITDLEPQLPQIPLDENRLEQAIVNLIVNAIDAMEDGGKLYIQANVIRDKNCGGIPHIQLKIRDTGVGIAPGNLSEIFEPFFTTKTQGTGLGLTIVKKVVDQHQGEIEINSKPGKGTEISIKLPVQPQKYEAKKFHISY